MTGQLVSPSPCQLTARPAGRVGDAPYARQREDRPGLAARVLRGLQSRLCRGSTRTLALIHRRRYAAIRICHMKRYAAI